MHPDFLIERLSAQQIIEWWVLYQLEPWGEGRDDLRHWAAVQISPFSDNPHDASLAWPYVEPPMTREEIKAEMDAIERAIDGNRRKNQHPA